MNETAKERKARAEREALWGDSPLMVCERLGEAERCVWRAESILRDYAELVAERRAYYANAPFGHPAARKEVALSAAAMLAGVRRLLRPLAFAYAAQPMPGEGDGLARIRMGKDAGGWRVPAASAACEQADDGGPVGEAARVGVDWDKVKTWAAPAKWDAGAGEEAEEGPTW